jgi:hypothetical protein
MEPGGAGSLPPMGGRSTRGLIADAFGLYRRFPLLFLVLAAAVIVPYQLIVLALEGTDGSSAGAGTEIPLFLLFLFVAAPLVSALHMHAISDVRRGEEPRLGPVARRGLAALPVVCAATIMSLLGIYIGFAFFVIPGVYLWLRWFVVPQVAAIEGRGWTAALRNSSLLTEGSRVHVFVFGICIGVIMVAPGLLLGLALGRDGIVPVVARTALDIVVISFTALAIGLLYYDLRARREALAAESGAPVPEPAPRTPKPLVEHSPDPRHYSDEERPRGWYVDPESPHRMRHWDDGGSPGWEGTARTPRRLRREWESENGGGA